MARPSDELIELENLSGAAHHHKQLCESPDCVTSLTLMKHTAKRLAAKVNLSEIDRAYEILKDWPY